MLHQHKCHHEKGYGTVAVSVLSYRLQQIINPQPESLLADCGESPSYQFPEQSAPMSKLLMILLVRMVSYSVGWHSLHVTAFIPLHNTG